MARLRPSLSVLTAIAIASGTLLLGSAVLGSSALASPCPLSTSSHSNAVGGPRNPNGLDRTNRADRTGGFDGMSSSGGSFRRSDSFNGGRDSGLSSDARWLNVTKAEVAGFGAIVGLFAIAIFFKMRHARKLAPAEADLLSKHPFLEHPEMVLALVPQEALSSAFETEATATRW